MPHRRIPPPALSRARTLRGDMTEAEKRLWYRLRAHRLHGASFRRQVPFGRYIVDFVCLEARLIVEVDGGQHGESSRDQTRDAWLRSQDFVVLRFWNNDVLSNTEVVLEQIAQRIPPSLALPRKGGGDWPRRADAAVATRQRKARVATSTGATLSMDSLSRNAAAGSTSPLAGEVGEHREPGGGR